VHRYGVALSPLFDYLDVFPRLSASYCLPIEGNSRDSVFLEEAFHDCLGREANLVWSLLRDSVHGRCLQASQVVGQPTVLEEVSISHADSLRETTDNRTLHDLPDRQSSDPRSAETNRIGRQIRALMRRMTAHYPCCRSVDGDLSRISWRIAACDGVG
jgi:hypothetical protein